MYSSILSYSDFIAGNEAWHKISDKVELRPDLINNFNCWISFAPVFKWVARHPRDLQVSVATRFCRVLIFVLSLYLYVIYLFPVMIHWWVTKPSCGPNICMFWAMTEAEGEVGYRFKPPSILILTVPRRYFCCGSLLLLVLAVRIYTLVQLLC